jgi:antitoxin VapB
MVQPVEPKGELALAHGQENSRFLDRLNSPAYAYGIYRAMSSPKPGSRQVRLFRNNRNQAIRIPVEFELPGDEAIISRDGDRLIIEPLRKKSLLALRAIWEPLDEDFPEIEYVPTKSEDFL